MATGTDFLMRKITLEADELARQYNKTKDPGLRDQWFKKVNQVPPASVLEEERLSSRKRT